MYYTKEYKIKYINIHADMQKDFGLKKRGGNIQCIFHSDHKPSARIYTNNSFYCFTCQRFFYPINIVYKLNLDINEVFDSLFEAYGYQDLEIIEKEIKKVEIKGKSIIEFTKEFFEKD